MHIYQLLTLNKVKTHQKFISLVCFTSTRIQLKISSKRCHNVLRLENTCETRIVLVHLVENAHRNICAYVAFSVCIIVNGWVESQRAQNEHATAAKLSNWLITWILQFLSCLLLLLLFSVSYRQLIYQSFITLCSHLLSGIGIFARHFMLSIYSDDSVSMRTLQNCLRFFFFS